MSSTQTKFAYNADPTRFGACGVDIFFGLSGLLITTLLLEEWQTEGSCDLRGFYIRRAFRILPPYLAYLAVCTGAGLWRSSRKAAGCLFFFRNYVPDRLAGAQHLWSLAVEEHFYLLWPMLLFLLLRPRRARLAAWPPRQAITGLRNRASAWAVSWPPRANREKSQLSSWLRQRLLRGRDARCSRLHTGFPLRPTT